MVCLFCLRETSEGISISGISEEATKAREIVVKYFWFDLNEINAAHNYACSDCWVKVMAFHEFYVMVELIHQTSSKDIDDKNFLSPSFECEFDIGNAIKLEKNMPEPCIQECNAVYIETPSIWEDCGEQINYSEANLSPHTSMCNKEYRKTKTKPFKLTSKRIKKKAILKKPKPEPHKRIGKSVRNVQEIRCYMCNKLYGTFRGLRNHFHMHDPVDGQTYECNLCGKKYPREKLLKKHMTYHVSREKYPTLYYKGQEKTKCPICEKELAIASLKSHTLRKHENIKIERPKIHMCEVCGKGFSAPSLLSSHALTHLDRKLTEVQCDICGKWMKNRNKLRRHKYTHNQVPETCPHCGKVKMSHERLQAHILFVHSERKHKCTFCEKSFARANTLREHIATHTGESLYDCPYCVKNFKCEANKYKHMREQHLAQWNLDRAKKTD